MPGFRAWKKSVILDHLKSKPWYQSPTEISKGTNLSIQIVGRYCNDMAKNKEVDKTTKPGHKGKAQPFYKAFTGF